MRFAKVYEAARITRKQVGRAAGARVLNECDSRVLNDIGHVISTRDAENNEMDAREPASTRNFHRADSTLATGSYAYSYL